VRKKGLRGRPGPDARVPDRTGRGKDHFNDPEGRLVARVLDRAVPKKTVTGTQSRTEGPADQHEWQALCEALLMLAHSHAVECRILRERAESLNERLRETEEELRVANRIAEDLYEFFSRTARSVASRKKTHGGRSGGY
jgi:hypothetical protein